MINHIIHPFVIKRSAPKPRGLGLSPLGAVDDAQISAESRGGLTEVERKLLASGFGPATYATIPSKGTTRLCTALFTHMTEPTIANVLVIDGRVQPPSVTTRFADGIKLVTTNSWTIVVTPTPPNVDGVRFPHIRDARELYSAHQKLVIEHASSASPLPLAPGFDPIQDAEVEARKTQDYWVERGYYRYVAGDRMRVTWRGATLAAWRRLFPWSLLTSLRHDRKTRLLCVRHGLQRPPGCKPR